MIFRTRDLFVRQRTQTINALRAHLAEHGLIVPQGLSNLAGIQRLVEKRVTDLEPLVAETARIYLEQINDLTGRIAKMEAFESNHSCYGYRRLRAYMTRRSISISEKVVRRLMKQEVLVVQKPKRRRYSSYPGEVSPAPENIINRDFHGNRAIGTACLTLGR